MLLDRAGGRPRRHDARLQCSGSRARSVPGPAVIERYGRTRSREICLHKAEPCDRFAIVRVPRTTRFADCRREGAREATAARSPENWPYAGVPVREASSSRAGHPGLEPGIAGFGDRCLRHLPKASSLDSKSPSEHPPEFLFFRKSAPARGSQVGLKSTLLNRGPSGGGALLIAPPKGTCSSAAELHVSAWPSPRRPPPPRRAAPSRRRPAVAPAAADPPTGPRSSRPRDRRGSRS